MPRASAVERVARRANNSGQERKDDKGIRGPVAEVRRERESPPPPAVDRPREGRATRPSFFARGHFRVAATHKGKMCVRNVKVPMKMCVHNAKVPMKMW